MAASQSGADVGINRRVGMGVGLGKTTVGNRMETSLKKANLKAAVRTRATVQLSAEVGINRRAGMGVGLGKTTVENRMEASLTEAILQEAVQTEAEVHKKAVRMGAAVRKEDVQTREEVRKEAIRTEAAMDATFSTRTGFLVCIIIILSIITIANTILIVVIIPLQ